MRELSALVGALVVIFAMTTSVAKAARVSYPAKAVKLSDASDPPSYLRILHAGRSVTKVRQCAPYEDYWTELSAYHWTGAALPPQTFVDRSGFTGYRWGKVSFDGITFTNRYPFAVLVAGWC